MAVLPLCSFVNETSVSSFHFFSSFLSSLAALVLFISACSYLGAAARLGQVNSFFTLYPTPPLVLVNPWTPPCDDAAGRFARALAGVTVPVGIVYLAGFLSTAGLACASCLAGRRVPRGLLHVYDQDAQVQGHELEDQTSKLRSAKSARDIALDPSFSDGTQITASI